VKPVVTVAEMQAIDAEARDEVEEAVLVQRAGTALGTWGIRMMGGAYGRRVVVIAGRGNNGADGRVAGVLIRRRGASVQVFEADAAPSCIGPPGAVDLVIDAAYGTGFRGTYRAPSVPPGVGVLAADIPSGVGGDNGAACGEVLRADLTVTFAALKPGLLQGDGPSLSGRVEVADIGLDVSRAHLWVVEDSDVAELLPRRERVSYKWQSAVAVVAGSPGMTGAAELCVLGAYRAGAGMVRLGVPGADLDDLRVAEAVGATLPSRGWAPAVLEMAQRCKALVVGPGLGREEETVSQVRRLIAEAPVPVVVDADGLWALGTGEEVGAVLKTRSQASEPDVVLTPHDGEFARMTGSAPGKDRIADVTRLAAFTGTVALLKGPTTVVARPDGRALLSVAGSPRLATAGTGDVLSGVIGAFLARGLAPLEAAALAAHVHARSAELGPAEGLVAGDVTDLVARWLSGIRRG
jgi:NAD(P)H-hydrate epimerase